MELSRDDSSEKKQGVYLLAAVYFTYCCKA